MENEGATQIPNSFDEFMNPQVLNSDTDKNDKESLSDKFSSERFQWTSKIKNMSEYFKNVIKISELMHMVYTERQLAVEYYHYLVSLIIKINKVYKKSYAEKYDFYSWVSQKRFPNEATKNNQIQSELGDILEKREMIDNHMKFIDSTIKSIDNIIYGMKSRIEIEQIARGK